MSDRAKQIGFSSQRIRLAWMDYAARLVHEATSISEAKEALLVHLGLDLAGSVKGNRSSREKALTVLMRTWITPSPDLKALRDDCLTLLDGASDSMSRVAIHWAMIGAAYPFWLAVATSAGRLLRLQQSLTASQVRRRLSETYGDRELVARATRTVLRSFVDWGVLDGAGTKGTYSASPLIELDASRIVAPLFEALVGVKPGNRMSSHELVTHPSLFPFRLGQISPQAIAAASRRLEVHETGSGEVIGLNRMGDQERQ